MSPLLAACLGGTAALGLRELIHTCFRHHRHAARTRLATAYPHGTVVSLDHYRHRREHEHPNTSSHVHDRDSGPNDGPA